MGAHAARSRKVALSTAPREYKSNVTPDGDTYVSIYLRRKQPPATAWYAVLSNGADSACSRDLFRDLLFYMPFSVLVSFEDERKTFFIDLPHIFI